MSGDFGYLDSRDLVLGEVLAGFRVLGLRLYNV